MVTCMMGGCTRESGVPSRGWVRVGAGGRRRPSGGLTLCRAPEKEEGEEEQRQQEKEEPEEQEQEQEEEAEAEWEEEWEEE